MKHVLLINAEGVQTISLAKSLKAQGCRVIGFCNHKISSGYATRWLSERHKTPDITQNTDDFKAYLYKYLENHKVDLIIPLADDGAEFLSRYKTDIENKFNLKCAIVSYDTFNIANNKHLLMKHCAQHGICHPVTEPLPSIGNDDFYSPDFLNKLKSVAEHVGFPCIIKPNLSQGAKGIVRVDSMEDIYEKFPDIYTQFGECTLQSYVEQPDYYYNVMLYRDRNGKTNNYTIIKIRRFFPLKGGSSCYCETVENNYLLNQCRTVLDTLDWWGFADFDVLEDIHTRELKIIEINPRVPSSLQAAFAAGIDFGKVFVSDIFNADSPSFEYATDKQVRWMGLDVMWFLFSKDRFRFKPSWFKFFGENISYHDGAWNDPLPMFAGMFAGILKYLNPKFRKTKLNS